MGQNRFAESMARELRGLRTREVIVEDGTRLRVFECGPEHAPPIAVGVRNRSGLAHEQKNNPTAGYHDGAALAFVRLANIDGLRLTSVTGVAANHMTR